MSTNKRWPDGSPRLPLMRCPHCGKKLNAASVLQDDPPLPKPGDLSVCFGCGEVLAFDQRLRLRRTTAVEIAGLSPSEADELRETQTAIRSFMVSD